VAVLVLLLVLMLTLLRQSLRQHAPLTSKCLEVTVTLIYYPSRSIAQSWGPKRGRRRYSILCGMIKIPQTPGFASFYTTSTN
jgi:hypothetical protein